MVGALVLLAALIACIILHPERVRRWWLRRTARHSPDPERRERAARLLGE